MPSTAKRTRMTRREEQEFIRTAKEKATAQLNERLTAARRRYPRNLTIRIGRGRPWHVLAMLPCFVESTGKVWDGLEVVTVWCCDGDAEAIQALDGQGERQDGNHDTRERVRLLDYLDAARKK